MAATQRDRAQQWDLAELRVDYLAALKHLGAAAQRVRDALDSAAVGLLAVRDQLRAEGRASDLVALVEPKVLRAELSDALTDLERSRHQSQKVLFRILFTEGTSMSDIARSWGISRQLVSRLINEPN